MLDFLVNWKFSFLILFQLLIQLVHQYMVQALNNLLFATIFSICQYRQYIISKRFINSTDYWQYHSFSQRSFIQLYPGGACIITNFLANYQCILNWNLGWNINSSSSKSIVWTTSRWCLTKFMCTKFFKQVTIISPQKF